MNIYENIQKAAKQAKISITNLEIACGFKNGTIGKWKISIPKVDNLYKVAQYLNKPLEYFLVGETTSGGKTHNNVLTNSISESTNATLIINQPANDFSKQELELVATYRELSIEKQAELIQYLLELKK